MSSKELSSIEHRWNALMETIPPVAMCYKQFRKLVITFYQSHARRFAWRHTSNPYHILVSEIMLQQTQTYRVEPKYQAFIAAFPTITSLAQAPFVEVLRLWKGLGYNRRARALHTTANILLATNHGTVPASLERLLQLPGIGPGTAGAILAYAFNQPVTFIETNIRTVFLHFFFKNKLGIHDRELIPFIEQTLDRENPRDWYYALTDLGVALKATYQNPSRRSKHHTTQNKFEGSDRQLRGKIIAAYLDNLTISTHNLATQLNQPLARVQKLTAQLMREKLIS
jgi:A/G-specific adenine glycosylase